MGIVPVPDARLDALAAIDHPAKIVPATVEFVDIAGLVEGASKGEGLGNQFLANIRETDAICEVVRFFSDPDVVHVNGKVNPTSDVETIRPRPSWPTSARSTRPSRAWRKRPNATKQA